MAGTKGKSGRKKNPPQPHKLIKEIIPIEEIFDEQEVALYHDLVDVYIADFDRDDLSSSDVDDIMDLAKNRILEFRLLKSTKDNADKHLDISAALEKIKKEKIKDTQSWDSLVEEMKSGKKLDELVSAIPRSVDIMRRPSPYRSTKQRMAIRR